MTMDNTTDNLDEKVARLSPVKRALLDLRLKNQKEGLVARTIPRRTTRGASTPQTDSTAASL